MSVFDKLLYKQLYVRYTMIRRNKTDRFMTSSMVKMSNNSFKDLLDKIPLSKEIINRLWENCERKFSSHMIPTDTQQDLLPKLMNYTSSLLDYNKNTNDFKRKHQHPHMIIQGRTGSGKTLLYLLKAIEIAYHSKLYYTSLNACLNMPLGVSVLIIVPTRELAVQIFGECKWLISGVYSELNVLCFAEECSRFEEMTILKKKCPNILISSVNRLYYHCQKTMCFNVIFKYLQLIIFDEADRLLNDIGYYNTQRLIEQLEWKHVPKMFVSATIDDNVLNFDKSHSEKESTITLISQEKNKLPHVVQYLSIVPATSMCTALYSIIRKEIEIHPDHFKILVFFPTSSMTTFAGLVFRNRLMLPPIHIVHSGKSPIQRAAAYESLRRASTGIIFGSHTAARGIDIPHISLVIQLGFPISYESYIHLAGRTGRSDHYGKSVLILSELEKNYWDTQSDMRELLKEESRYKQQTCRSKLKHLDASDNLILSSSHHAYHALLTYYILQRDELRLMLSNDEIVLLCNEWFWSFGMTIPPSVDIGFAESLQLSGAKGLRTQIDYMNEDCTTNKKLKKIQLNVK